ncbi:putative mitochondrial chaperone BCS1-B [Paramyrothecium foliicola]|nr:putative mitochondrial chaperone BCS1-B [Paramyrothecium foliicola]
MPFLGSLVMENLTGSETTGSFPAMASPQFAVLDYLVPGFSVFSSAVQTYLGINLNLYIPLLLIVFSATFAWNYISEVAWGLVETHLMSSVSIRTDDEIYNMIMMWIARQKFAQRSRRFIVNTNINSRSWFLWRSFDEEEDEEGGENGDSNNTAKKKKSLQYTPSFGTHFFWYGNYILLFERHENREQNSALVVSEREELSIKCFGRNPAVIKKLLLEARDQYLAKDDKKTLIYRGAFSSLNGDPSWQRCMARSSRPFSTVILNDKVKKDLVDDVTDYLNPETRRWYANRGIPYRRGYLLYGPPGTGKSSLSLALAGFFQMKIYIVSLSSAMANEENLSTLFADLPRRCVVLLEDIDSAGLTHTREENGTPASAEVGVPAAPATPTNSKAPVIASRLSLSGLLNILDGVASQEGRVLIMTTNHLEKLDKALIRPGRVDMIVKFGLADADMTAAIFRAIYAPYEGELQPGEDAFERVETAAEMVKRQEKEREDETARVSILAKKFAATMPEHEFSPAEIQGLLLRHKRDPEGVIDEIDEWVVQTRKDKKQKEIEDAEKRRKEDEKRKKKEAKAKRKEERRKARKKKKRAEKRKNGEDSSSEDDNSDSDSSASEDEAEAKDKEKEDKAKVDPVPEDASVEEKAESMSTNTEDVKNENESEKTTTTTTTDATETEKKADDEKKSPSDSGYDT